MVPELEFAPHSLRPEDVGLHDLRANLGQNLATPSESTIQLASARKGEYASHGRSEVDQWGASPFGVLCGSIDDGEPEPSEWRASMS